MHHQFQTSAPANVPAKNYGILTLGVSLLIVNPRLIDVRILYQKYRTTNLPSSRVPRVYRLRRRRRLSVLPLLPTEVPV